MTAARLLRLACSCRGSAAIEEVMALAVMLPVVIAAIVLAARAFSLFNDVVAVVVGSPFP
jgi:hypothetical protein